MPNFRQKALASLVQLPKGQLTLVRAACDSDDNARMAWQSWLGANDLDDADWQDHKLLALIAQRLGDLDPENPLRARLRGLSKMHWTLTQLAIRQALDAVDALQRSEIDVMLLKGAAMDASGLALPGPRISGDLDILVRRKDFASALQILIDNGWQMKNRSLNIGIVARIRPGMNLHRGDQGDVDLHHQPIHSPVLSDDEIAAFWKRSVQVDWLGRRLFVPSINDQFLITAVHACRSTVKSPSSPLWPINLSMLARSDKLDVVAIASRAKLWQSSACLEAIVPHVHELPEEVHVALLSTQPSAKSTLLLLAGRLGTVPRTLLLGGLKIFAPRMNFFELPNAAYYLRRWISKRLGIAVR